MYRVDSCIKKAMKKRKNSVSCRASCTIHWNKDIKNCKSDVDDEASRVALRSQKLRDAQKEWGDFLKNEVHNLTEFDQVMNKFDIGMAKKGAAIIEKETALKMGKLTMDFMLKDLNTNEKSKEFVYQVAEIQQNKPEQVISFSFINKKYRIR